MAGIISYRRGNGLMNTGFGEIHKMFDDFFSDNWLSGSKLTVNTFKIDLKDNESEYVVEAELPGVNKGDIQLSLNEEVLNISVFKQEAKEEEEGNYIHRERATTSMTRKVYLPESDAEGIKAKLDNGILEISIPKKAKPDTSKKIDIE
ncbi:MAG: Hsp20/alpha crystallin family protein [Clostridium sp.]